METNETTPKSVDTNLEQSRVEIQNNSQEVNIETTVDIMEAEKVEIKSTEASEKSVATEISQEESSNKNDSTPSNQENDLYDNDSAGVEIDYSGYSKHEILTELKTILGYDNLDDYKVNVENLRAQFYKKLKQEKDDEQRKFLADGGTPEAFTPQEDPIEIEFKELYKGYREQRNEIRANLETQYKNNLAIKEKIIEEIKELIDKPESLNDTFVEFKKLQTKWRETGLVPPNSQKSLYENYQLAIRIFYDWVDLNKAARDEDLKRNLEAKIELCEKAESLLIESDIRKALGELRIYHERWREIGPVQRERSDEIWERFSEATKKIHIQHQEYFLSKKEEQEGNYNAKSLLCEKAEEISSKFFNKRKDWENSTNDILELQKVWKTIGMVPKSKNDAIFKRFRTACQTFFNNKKTFYEGILENEMKNLQLKTDLCILVESEKESKDWKKSTDKIINAQKKWKTIGPVPRKYSDEIWTRFRAACNEFFDRKNSHYSSLGEMLDENIKRKEELITLVKEFELSNDNKADLHKIKTIQKEWTEIGTVSADDRARLNKEFRTHVNSIFDKMKMGSDQKESLQFKIKLEEMNSQPNAKELISKERQFIINNLRKLETDIKQWENNIGFFSNTKKADKLLEDFHKKIESGKKLIDIMKQKVKMIDEIKY